MTLTTVNPALLDTQAQYTGFKNRIINGAMVISQRNAGASVSCDANVYGLDRWQYVVSQTGKLTVQQNAGSVTPPVGFSNYMGFTSTSAYSVGTTEYFWFQQAIEGFNVADLNWGTANAKTVTLSFQVYSSLTGNFGGALQNSAANRSYPFSYTVSSANTWTTVSVTIAGDTTGTWLTTNGIGISVVFGLGVGLTSLIGTAGAWAAGQKNSVTGATSVVGTSGATFYITGVQLEKGSTATSFDYRPYGTELALCQRYYTRFGGNDNAGGYTGYASGYVGTTLRAFVFFTLPTEMRTTPTLSAGGSNRIIYAGGNTLAFSGFGNTQVSTSSGYIAVDGVSAVMTQGQTAGFGANGDTTAFLAFSAEL